MKYKPNEDYLFESEIVVSGLNAKQVEEKLKTIIKSAIKENNPKLATLSNESVEKNECRAKCLQTIEELQTLINCKIKHIGRIPEGYIEELKLEMEEKEELDKKRLAHLRDCVVVWVEKEKETLALIVNRKGIYSVSKSLPI